MSCHHKTRRRRIVGPTTDAAFDRLLPEQLRHLSRVHWTPVEVAIRAAALLAPAGRARVLDVGSGVGKVCAVGALSTRGSWCGVEQHEPLVQAARSVTRAMGLAARTSFVHGDALSLDWDEFDAIYLYNPFELPLFEPRGGADHARDSRVQVALVQDRLAALRPGVRVVTFNGFGGVMPSSLQLVYQERVPGVGLDLVLWVQHEASRFAPAVS